MLKTQNRVFSTVRIQLQLILFLITVLLVGTAFVPVNKEVVTFFSSDSLQITANDYFISDTLPYVILIHEQGSSRGEFDPIINRFQKMNYNCLSVDLRNGGNSNYIANETAKRCRVQALDNSYANVEEDIKASIEFAFNKSELPIILVGSGANGALALKVTKDHNLVIGAIALSPGEYFSPGLNIETEITGIEKPLLLTATKTEFPYVNQLVSGVEETYKTVYAPEESDGARGVKALLPESPSSGDYWLSILLFIKDLK